jgi:hypothetical protein
VDFEFSVVFDKTQFAEFVHEKAYARSGRADHLRQRFLTKLSHDRPGHFFGEGCLNGHPLRMQARDLHPSR